VLSQGLRVVWKRRKTIFPSALAASPNGHAVALLGFDRQVGSNVVLVVTESSQQEVARGVAPTEERSARPTMSWDDAGSQLLFESSGEIRILNVQTRASRVVARGLFPTWSPNGRWIAYRTPEGEAMLLNAHTGISHPMGIGSMLRSGLIHWSPDSEYVFVAQDYGHRSQALNCFGDNSHFFVYRLSDLARKLVFDPCGLRDERFGWLAGKKEWLEAARNATGRRE
jgi:hypothetical protein